MTSKSKTSGAILLLAVFFWLGTVIALAIQTLRVPVRTVQQPPVIMEVLDPSLGQFEEMWRAEINRKFDHAVGILVHGGDFVEGQWIVGTGYGRHVSTVGEVVSHYQHLYPDRTIVLLACNPGHIDLHMPGVYYAKSSVWCVPDRALTPAMMSNGKSLQHLGFPFLSGDVEVPRPSRWALEPDVVGNIYEFVSE